MNIDIDPKNYINHPYNNTSINERAIELPIAYNYINLIKERKENLVELGAVSPYYWDINHEVIDAKDSKATRIALSNSIDFSNKNVLSISTIEHIGTNDYNINVDYSAFNELLRIYAECRSCLISWPIGYNIGLDTDTRKNIENFEFFFYIKQKNIWIKSHTLDNFNWKYDPFGNSIIFIHKNI